MADKTIDDLTAASALTGTEKVPVWQGGTTKETSTQDIADLASPDLSGFVKRDGSVTGATASPQRFDNGAYTITGGDVENGFDATSTYSKSNNDSTYSKLISDGSTQQTTKNGSLVLSVITKSIKVHLSSADIKTLNSSPITIIDPLGAGYVRVINAQINYQGGGQEFDSFTLYIVTEGANLATAYQLRTYEGILNQRNNWVLELFSSESERVVNDSVYFNNATVVVKSDSDSAVGDCSADLYVTYQIIST